MHRAGKRQHEVVVEKMSSTTITDDLIPEWLAAVSRVQDAINDGVDGMEDVLEFLEEFKTDSDRAIAVKAFDIQPRSCGSCHMLTGNYDGNRYNAKSLKCVYENGPEFEYGSVVKWFKLCEYYIQRVD